MRSSATKALLAGVALVLCALPSTASAQIAFAPCPQYPSLQCASLAVPLDRSSRLPGTIHLAAVRRVAPANPGDTAVLALAVDGSTHRIRATAASRAFVAEERIRDPPYQRAR